MWVVSVDGFRPCSERFLSGYSRFSVPSKTNISKFQFDRECPQLELRANYINYLHK